MPGAQMRRRGLDFILQDSLSILKAMEQWFRSSDFFCGGRVAPPYQLLYNLALHFQLYSVR